MGVRIPGAGSGLIDPKLVDQLVAVEKIPVENAKKRRENVTTEKKEFSKLVDHVNELDKALNALKSKASFYKLKVESSHPDIIDGVVQGYAMPGSYEFEVRGLAKAEKELAYGFPNKDEYPVGFGFMVIEREEQDPLEVVVEPGATLQDVANQINELDGGVKAMVINTKYKPDAFRLIVISEKSGKESKIIIDEDTTFLEFKEQVSGRNLDILFEDVPITDEDNTLEELIDGVVFFAKRSEPGTRIQVNINFDLDATLEGIKTFVEKYNQIASFIHGQFQKNPDTDKAGVLAADGTIKQVMRTLQSAVSIPQTSTGKYRTLADIGITTDPKTGNLNMDESKVRGALAEDYESVADIFVRSRTSVGIAEQLAERVKAFRDPNTGALKSRVRALDKIIQNSDEDIERRERQLEQKEENLRRRFTNLEGRLSELKSQGDYLSQRFGAGQQGGGGQGGQ